MRMIGRAFGCGLLMLITAVSFAQTQSTTRTDQNGYYEKEGRLNSWTTDDVYRRRFDGDIQFLNIRFGKHEGFDRVVFEFKGHQGKLLGYSVNYDEPPFEDEDGGAEVKVHGRKFIRITLYPTASSDEKVEANNRIVEQQNRINMPVIREVQMVEWFEGELTYVFGLKRQTPFRVQVLSNPTRLVVDFRH